MDTPDHASSADWQHGLPADLWISEIATHLDPLDVMALSLTCKALRAIIHQHSVWASVLWSLCKRHGLFLPSYPVDDMDVRDIQRAAIAPHLWKRMLNKEGVPPMELKDSRPLPVVARGGNLYGYGAYLTTGGRFCVTFQRKDSVFAEIVIWDIGLPGSNLFANPRRIGSRTEQFGSDQEPADITGTFWEEQGNTLTMVLTQKRTLPQGPGDECISVLSSDISIRDGSASVTPCTARLTVSQNVSLWPCKGILRSGYVFLYEQTATVYVLYNLATDRCTVWKTGLHGLLVTTTMFDGEHVVSATSDSVCIWSVVALELEVDAALRSSTVDLMAARIVPPHAILPAPWPRIDIHRVWFAQQTMRSLDSPATFNAFWKTDLAHGRGNSETTCVRYVLGHDDGAAGSGSVLHPAYSLKALSTWAIPAESFVPSVRSLICQSFDIPHFNTDSYNRQLHSVLYFPCTQGQISGETGEGGALVKVLQVEPDLIASACPVSGRFMFYRWDNAERRSTFYLVDYLA